MFLVIFVKVGFRRFCCILCACGNLLDFDKVLCFLYVFVGMIVFHVKLAFWGVSREMLV